MQKIILKNPYFIIYSLFFMLTLSSCNSSLSGSLPEKLSKTQTSSLATLSFSKVQVHDNHLMFDLSLSKVSPLSINFYILLENSNGDSVQLANAKTICSELDYRDSFLDCSKHTKIYKWIFTSGKHKASIKLPLRQKNLDERFVLKVITFNTFIAKQNYKNTLTGKNTLFKTSSLVSTPDKLNLLENYGNLTVPVYLNTNNSFAIKYKVKQITAETIYLLGSKDSIATENADFVPSEGSFIINTDQNTREININILDDKIYEGSQSFVLTLISDQAIFDSNTEKHILITIDDDEEAPYLQISNSTFIEKNEVQNWPVSLSWPSELRLSFDYKLHSTWTNNAEISKDYSGDRGSVEFLNREIQKFIPVNIITDNIPEDTESFSLSIKKLKILQLSKNDSGLYTAFVTDTNTGVVPSAQFSAKSLNTTNGRSINIPIELKGPATSPVTVYYRSFSKTAMPSIDFEDKAGVLHFPASTKAYQVQNINIKILNTSFTGLQKASKEFYIYIEKVQNGKISTNRKININIL
ncbi:MAG: hypothetical protein HAW60_05040 [Bdellovibrionales bacterium]|nr:hypothetical protein [Bdellovibrionales bacterium]